MILVTAISALDYGVDMTIINLTDNIVKQFNKQAELDKKQEEEDDKTNSTVESVLNEIENG